MTDRNRCRAALASSHLPWIICLGSPLAEVMRKSRPAVLLCFFPSAVPCPATCIPLSFTAHALTPQLSQLPAASAHMWLSGFSMLLVPCGAAGFHLFLRSYISLLCWWCRRASARAGVCCCCLMGALMRGRSKQTNSMAQANTGAAEAEYTCTATPVYVYLWPQQVCLTLPALPSRKQYCLSPVAFTSSLNSSPLTPPPPHTSMPTHPPTSLTFTSSFPHPSPFHTVKPSSPPPLIPKHPHPLIPLTPHPLNPPCNRYPDGSVYTGQWEAGLKHGQGVYWDTSKGCLQGSWVKGVLAGEVRSLFSPGSLVDELEL